MEKKSPLFTDLEITSHGMVGCKRYFSSICRNLPKDWKFLRFEKYEDNDTFKILNEVICLMTPWYRDVVNSITFSAKIFLGITDTSILILRIDFDSKIKKEETVNLIGYVINRLDVDVLKPNRYYPSFNHKYSFGGPRDENWHKADIRDQRQIRLLSKADNKLYSLSKGTEAKIEKSTVFFNEPNNISLALSIMKRTYKKAHEIYKKLKLKNSQGSVEIVDENKLLLYDYFEEIITCLTFAYISIESFSNAAIPESYKHRIKNEKGVKEIWPKESIERWMSTSDKVSEILPKIFKSSDIKQEQFWPQFKELEKLRNDIVHQRTIEKGTRLDSEIFKYLINYDVFNKIKSSLSVIEFFYKLDNAYPYFPLGLGIATFQIHEIESMEKHFKKIS
jgi:hypothetical protein